MKKQNYEKPMASFMAFYSEKDIAENQSVWDHTQTNPNEQSATVGSGGTKPDNWD